MSTSPGILPEPIPANLAKFPISTLEKRARHAEDWVVKGFVGAPDLSAGAPCYVLLPIWYHNFLKTTSQISAKRSVPYPSTLRSQNGKFLDIVIEFANSIWTAEQQKTFQSCSCDYHNREQVKFFEDDMYRNIHGHCEGFGPLHKLVSDVFLIIADIADDIRNNQADAIRLQRKPNKRGKWPSSPSQFIPHGASRAVVAFMKWAQLGASPKPLRALTELTFCCPSLEDAMAKNEDLLPVVASLFSDFVNSVKRITKPEELSFERKAGITNDIYNFFLVIGGSWCVNQTIAAGIQTKRSTVSAIISLFMSLGSMVPLIERFVYNPELGKMIKERFSITAVGIFHTYISPGTVPLSPEGSFLCYSQYYGLRDDPAQVRKFTNNLVSFRNEPRCAHLHCTQTSNNSGGSGGAKANLKACAGCQVVRYCSRGCQAGDWKAHKQVCKPLEVLLPLAFLFWTGESESSASGEELCRRFCVRLMEMGLTGEAVSETKEYTQSRSLGSSHGLGLVGSGARR